ncbi:MAG: hypothetical protein RI925_1811 [Pseudomonadota bacterium]
MKLTASRPDPLTGSGFFHPLVPLAGWLALALMLPLWSGPCQLLAAGLMALLAGWRQPAVPWQALRRVRWLLITLVAAMGWSVPGQALWSADWAPTREGVMEGLAHALRLLTLLWCMKWLFARQSRQDWLLGLRSLCWPLVGLGLDVNRAALRLWLTLAETERLTGGASPHWRDVWQLLSAPPAATQDGEQVLTLQLRVLTGWDTLALIALLLAVGLSGWLYSG